jgi:hypothetical protein
VARGRHGWLRRWVLVGVLVAVAFAPDQASGAPSAAGCGAHRCGRDGVVLWARPLPGSWTAASETLGTVPAGAAQAYAAAGKAVAAIGSGMTVLGYAARGGQQLWTTALSGFPAGSRIVSVRVWPGVVTVGVARPRRSGAPGGPQSTVVLSAGAGRQLRSFPAAPFGGAITADARHTVIIGLTAVTSYDNATGRVSWARATGSAAQGWQKSGETLYVTEAAGGDLGSQPVTALRRISLRTGAEQVIRARDGSFTGRLGAVLDGVVLFSGAPGVSAYSGRTGKLMWQRAGALPAGVDVVRGLFYLAAGSTLAGVLASTGRTQARITGANGSGSAGVYGVRNGVALGLDQGQAGEAWGYDVAAQRVIWTTRTLPWPHYFVDLSGIGGSADPGSRTVILTACGQRIQVGARQVCQKPELVLVAR